MRDSVPLRPNAQRAELTAWFIVAVMTGATAAAFFRYMYLGLLSFILLPLVAMSWVRVVRLSGSGNRGRMLAVLTLATIVGGWLAANWAAAWFGSGGIHD